MKLEFAKIVTKQNWTIFPYFSKKMYLLLFILRIYCLADGAKYQLIYKISNFIFSVCERNE